MRMLSTVGTAFGMLVLVACGGGGPAECFCNFGQDAVGGGPDGTTVSDTVSDTTAPPDGQVEPPTNEIPDCDAPAEDYEGLLTVEMLWSPEGLESVPTFESIGVTVSYSQDDNDNSDARMVYRELPTGPWQWAHPMQIDRAHTEFRGSLVGLTQNRQYEVRVALSDVDGVKGTPVLCGTVSTWADTVSTSTPHTLQPGEFDQSIINVQSGTVDGWSVVRALAPGAAIIQAPTTGEVDAALVIEDLSYVIFQNLTIRGGRHGVSIARSHHIRFENCHITGWGQDGNPEENSHGIVIRAGGAEEVPVHAIVVQDTVIDEPLGNAGDWGSGAPNGPHGIYVEGGGGNHVFRRNRIQGSDEHWLVDGIGGGAKSEFHGGPGNNTDVHFNTISHCNDNAVDLGGGQANQRTFRNRFIHTFAPVSTVPVVLGPSYVFRNIAHDLGDRRGLADTFLRAGGAGGSPPVGLGAQHLYHNTVYAPSVDGKVSLPTAIVGTSQWGGGGEQFVRLRAHNNIWVTGQVAVVDNHYFTEPPTNVYDYNMAVQLFPLSLNTGGSTSGTHAEAHGTLYTQIDPLFIGFDEGDLRLVAKAPAIDKGRILRGFNDSFVGAAPDVGALERGDMDDNVPPLPPVPEPEEPPEGGDGP